MTTPHSCRWVMAMRRMLLPVLALTVGAATACGTASTGGTATPSASPPAAVTATAAPPTPTATATVTVTPTPPSPPPSPSARTPDSVVQAYYDAVNAHDYRTAWNLGGRNFNSTYSGFVAGFAGTAYDDLEILGVSGSTVTVSLVATQTSGEIKLYSGTYHVSGGMITGARISQVDTTPSQPPGVFVHPGAFCSPVGATGITDRGTPMVCSLKSGDDRARWRQQ